MLQTIIVAVQNKRILSFVYDGLARTVEPHAVGRSIAGHDVLRCYQTTGQSHHPPIPDWRLMEVRKIQNLIVVQNQNFVSPRPGYRRGDRGMTVIYAQL
jgi:hypothetical protein